VRVARIRLFAAAREAAGTGTDVIEAPTVAAALREACARYGERFAALVGTCRIWVNGEPAGPDDPLGPDDELAVLPPVSGGCTTR